jgi:uncharacterized BrkB/YihY/UPF0761 family membrane protein
VADGRRKRIRVAAHTAQERVVHVGDRPRAWVESGDAASSRRTALSWWQQYRRIDGPLQSLLLTVYVFLAILPAVLVLAEYLERNPAALANHFVRRYHLTGSAAQMIRNVFVSDRHHELGSALLAIVSVLIFGVGFGRVLQLVYGRAWGLEVREKLSDQIRFAAVLMVLFGLIVIFLVQTTAIAGHPGWLNPAISPAWVVVLFGFFVWAPRYLVHNRISARDLVPSSALTAVGLVALMLVSSFVMGPWIDFYGTDYGGLGVVLALFFWIGLSSTVIVLAASLSPVFAGRRVYLAGRAGASQAQSSG